MLINRKVINLSQKFNIFFSTNKSLLYLKGVLGFVSIKMPSSFFFKNFDSSLSFLFLNKFYINSFFSQFKYLYKTLFLFRFVKLKIKGLGYRIKRICSYLFRFFFGSTNYFYFHVPSNVIVRFKKRRILLLSNDIISLKSILAHLILLKKLSVYRVRGLIYPRQVILLKVGKRNI